MVLCLLVGSDAHKATQISTLMCLCQCGPSPCAVPCVCVSCVHITAAPELPLLSTETTLAHKNHSVWPWEKPNVCVSCTHPHPHCRGKCLFWQIRCCWEGNAPCEWDPVCTSLCVHHDLLWCLFQTGKRVPASISQLRRSLQGELGLRPCC